MWKDYLSFSRQEQKGFVFLICLLIILLVFRLVSVFIIPSEKIYVTRDDTLFKEIFTANDETNSPKVSDNIPIFNPNEVTFPFLIEIGLEERIAKNWINYLSKGGIFTKETDVGKVYGVESALLQILLPYMSTSIHDSEYAIPENKVNTKLRLNYTVDLNKATKEDLLQLGWNSLMIDTLLLWRTDYWIPQRYQSMHLNNWKIDSLMTIQQNLVVKKHTTSKASNFVIEMNSADTAQWTLLKGIGPVLSKRIVAYRKKLGGFVSPDQLIEVYGVSPVLVNDLRPYLYADTMEIFRININRASLRQLKDHPYLDFYKAQALIEERKKRGKFGSALELLDLPVFDDNRWEKIRPYLAVN